MAFTLAAVASISHDPRVPLLAVLNALKARTTDADPTVRGTTAKTFWLVHSLCSEKVDALIPLLEPAQQKLLKRNKP